MRTSKLQAGDGFPSLAVRHRDNGVVDISKPEEGCDWQMVVVYRGRHCPLCTKFLNNLAGYRDRLTNIGVGLAAVSADSRKQLEEHVPKLDAVGFPLYFGLSSEQMLALGLYISIPRSAEETDHNFAEPGLFVINSDGQLQMVDYSNNPFARPDLETLISGLEWIRNPANNYPIRGTFSEIAR